jgi:hypothetical protein
MQRELQYIYNIMQQELQYIYNIMQLNTKRLLKTVCEDLKLLHFAQDEEPWRGVVNTDPTNLLVA